MKHVSVVRIGLILFFLTVSNALAQIPHFTRQDTLRGSITPERVWWDLTYYYLDIKVDPEAKTIAGSNLIHYKVLQPYQNLQVDLQPPMRITRVTQNGRVLTYQRDGNAYFITLEKKQIKDEFNTIRVDYEGKPKVSRRPPWSGGITWNKDNNGKDFIGSTCQGDGASLWWPCKDHPYDEPDSMLMSVNVPAHLTDVSNGYNGNDVSHTGWGMKFDFIIVHESGYEWFANSITNNDAADMWIHEAFIAYSENLFLNYHYGKAASAEYVIGTRANIRNDRPIVGIRNVNLRISLPCG